MSFLTQPDRDRFPRPAERFQWRWNRVFLGCMGVGAVVIGFLREGEFPLPGVMPDGLAGLLSWGLYASALGGLALPAVSYLVGRARFGRAGVTGMLAGGAAVTGLVLAGFGSIHVALGSPPVSLAGGAFAAGGAALTLFAAFGRAREAGRWPGFGSAIIGALLLLESVVGWSGPQDFRDVSYRYSVRHDLQALAGEQERYRRSGGSYAEDLESLDYVLTEGVRVTVTKTVDGWIGRGFHLGVEGECVVFIGSSPPAAPMGGDEGEIVCEPDAWELRARGRRSHHLEWVGAMAAAFLLVTLVASRRLPTS